ncbi:hypothetical protein HanRHA438_Chr07g0303011 [Helianthus annuus]|nr:hypothetical protein HanIR_Chr07g0315581 [Helianthus annuus]KAJ0907778.1 hypothetical protein HanRHA438_Chr07g0303011 [Helianthus annuus]
MLERVEEKVRSRQIRFSGVLRWHDAGAAGRILHFSFANLDPLNPSFDLCHQLYKRVLIVEPLSFQK